MSEKAVLEGCPKGAVVEEFERTVDICIAVSKKHI